MKYQAYTAVTEETFRAVADDERYQIAVPAALGGPDVGVSPLTLMVSSLASCLSLMLYNQLGEWDTTGMKVHASAEKAKVKMGQTPYLTNWKTTIILPHIDINNEEVKLAIERGKKACPMDALLERAGEHIELMVTK